ncbi:MAG: SprT family zinc-dependent metalloprotease [Candidatus Omnitrophica bacterium]|nr:SprT family zinc-dependent metalloprotease [Candidatus Omnitrophota bacterium]
MEKENSAGHPPVHKIIRSRRRTVGLQVTSEAHLIVRVPHQMSEDMIRETVRKKLPWILRKQHYAREHYVPAALKTFTAGEKFLYLGEEHPLFVVPGAYGPLVFHDRGFFLREGAVLLAPWLFRDWYRERAEELLNARVRYYAGLTGARYARVGISNARGRWGSCSSKGVLNFNWRLVMAPRGVIDYVVVHEVVHLEELNHSKRFWEKVKVLAPDYGQAKRWLEHHQRVLHFDA